MAVVCLIVLSSTQTWQNPKGGIGSAFVNGNDYIDVDGDRGSSVNIILSKIIDDQFYY
ncbi:MAG: hypothetical protein EZS28_054465, partial [Streblomastix strix]